MVRVAPHTHILLCLLIITLKLITLALIKHEKILN